MLGLLVVWDLLAVEGLREVLGLLVVEDLLAVLDLPVVEDFQVASDLLAAGGREPQDLEVAKSLEFRCRRRQVWEGWLEATSPLLALASNHLPPSHAHLGKWEAGYTTLIIILALCHRHLALGVTECSEAYPSGHHCRLATPGNSGSNGYFSRRPCYKCSGKLPVGVGHRAYQSSNSSRGRGSWGSYAPLLATEGTRGSRGTS